MRSFTIKLLLIVLTVCNLGAKKFSYSSSVKKAAPAVVKIDTKKQMDRRSHPLLKDPFFKFFFEKYGDLDEESFVEESKDKLHKSEKVPFGLGSGVIIDAKKGLVVTNNHVIKGADDINVTLPDGREFPASIVGRDPNYDIALLKIKADKLPEIKVGNSSELEVGDLVLAIGNPIGLDYSVTQGIVSATGRSLSGKLVKGSSLSDNYIQTDAAINSGNSGGALIDIDGNLVGINTMIQSTTGGFMGYGLAIPINSANTVIERIQKFGNKRNYLGVAITDIPSSERASYGKQLPKNSGVIINQVVSNSPAHKLGLLPGDVIIKVNGNIINGSSHLIDELGKLEPGKRYKAEIIRDGKVLMTSIKTELKDLTKEN